MVVVVVVVVVVVDTSDPKNVTDTQMKRKQYMNADNILFNKTKYKSV